MTAVVTGASGHIGANLVRALIDAGQNTRSLVHVSCRGIEGLNTEIFRGDIRDCDSLYRAFDGADIVYHLAANISLKTNSWAVLKSINVAGTRNVIEACLHCGVKRLVHFSSIHALTQEPMDVPVDETRPLVESTNYPPYDRSKAASEKEVRLAIEKGLNAVIIYPTAVFGPHDYQMSYFGEALLSIARGKLPALVSGGFDWVDVRDVVKGAMLAAERAPAGAGYLLSGHWVSLCDLAAMVSEITGAGIPGLVCPMWLARLGAPFITGVCEIIGKRPLYTSVSMRALQSNKDISHEKATRELGYCPRPFRESLVDTLRWFEENGLLDRPVNAGTKE